MTKRPLTNEEQVTLIQLMSEQRGKRIPAREVQTILGCEKNHADFIALVAQGVCHKKLKAIQEGLRERIDEFTRYKQIRDEFGVSQRIAVVMYKHIKGVDKDLFKEVPGNKPTKKLDKKQKVSRIAKYNKKKDATNKRKAEKNRGHSLKEALGAKRIAGWHIP